MIIYNVTIQVQKQIAAEWLQWLQQEHIPEMMRTGCFTNHQLVKLLEQDQTEAITYAVQYYAASEELLNKYLHEHAAALRQAGLNKWGEKFIAFRTVMEVLH